MPEKIHLYDTTLRDGGQTSFVDFTLQNKLDLSQKLDELGLDYIEGGWPGANPVDTDYFAKFPKLKNAKITAFGMTSKKTPPLDNPGFKSLIDSKAKIVTIVGKGWDFQVKTALNISLKANLEIIESSIKALKKAKKEVFFDSEHFFDGFKENPEYSLQTIETAHKSGASWIILCDTNGGTLPNEIFNIVTTVKTQFPKINLGIHCHNDTGNAVANTLEAVRAGARQVQGTLNGLGERCGNANLVSLIPTLRFKLGYKISVSDKQIKNLKTISNYLCDLLNYPYDSYAPYVGASAFAHKGGLHASGVLKNTKCYEHVEPNLVGNSRNILVSNQAGKASIISRLKKLKIRIKEDRLDGLIKLVKEKEKQGFAYDLADASFAILAHNHFYDEKQIFELESYKILNEQTINPNGKETSSSEAVVKIRVNGKQHMNVAEGNGPVAALNHALKEILYKYYPELKKSQLSDYKVRILNFDAASDALIRVIIETTNNKGKRWTTVGATTDIISASYMAVKDSIEYNIRFK
jgi:2-isopropylmalate synthase